MLAIAILMVDRAMLTRPMLCFCPAKTCSTCARLFERLVLALAIRPRNDRIGFRFWWMLPGSISPLI